MSRRLCAENVKSALVETKRRGRDIGTNKQQRGGRRVETRERHIKMKEGIDTNKMR